MHLIDQHTAFLSQEQALVPKPDLVDSRTEKDRLNFLVDVASLLNFYDKNNVINGNWVPFLLKDPVFLLASIAKIPFQRMYALFLNTCLTISPPQKDVSRIVIEVPVSIINQLFDQQLHIFKLLERWTYYMQRTPQDYNLKTYVIDEVKQTYSAFLWALLALNEQLYLTKNIKGIIPIDTDSYNSYDEKIWKESKGKKPYWKVLGLDYPLETNNSYVIYEALKKSAEGLFTFLSGVVEYAGVEFDNAKVKKSAFPETTLLRTFTKLMDTYIHQINTLTRKHLEFYYRDILKEQEQLATSDKVFACVDLAKDDEKYTLKQNTLFDAGLDPDQAPIVFETIADTSLNPAVISNAYTLTKIKNTSDTAAGDQLVLNQIPTPGVLLKDEEGKVESWKTFGTTEAEDPNVQTMSLVFASPMFYLSIAAGRELKLTLALSKNVSSTQFDDTSCTFFLSTEKDWFEVSKAAKTLKVDVDGSTVTLTITLKDTDPPIAAFETTPDGLTNSWPLFKMEYQAFNDLEAPPCIISLKAETTVTTLQGFQLYNDGGLLSTKKPFQPLGPTPAKDQNFILGHAEVFSKPVKTVSMQLNWDNLPNSFSNYYEQYNKYARGEFKKVKKRGGAVKKIFDGIENIFKKPKTENKEELFNDESFKVAFQLLNNGVWESFNMNLPDKSHGNTEEVDDDTTPGVHVDTGEIKIEKYLLFQPSDAQTKNTADPNTEPSTLPIVLKPTSKFSSSDIQRVQTYIDPHIQKDPLIFSDSSSTGFFKMQLVAPSQGFGVSLYPQVIGAIALYNAEIIARKLKKIPLEQQPNEPFTPMSGLFTGNYTASKTYELSKTGDYPFTCFYKTPFKTYQVYDNTTGIFQQGLGLGTSTSDQLGLPLYPSFKSQGQLFMEMTNVLAPVGISLFFELAVAYTSTSSVSKEKIKYDYLGDTGWKSLSVLEDGTSTLNCSELLKINVPEDISASFSTMPGSYWITMSTKNAPDHYPQTVFLKTNGIELSRAPGDFLTSTSVPSIAADAIVGPQTAIPQLAGIVQPFPSFGGIGAETNAQMDQRVSLRLKTKDRVVSLEDYYRVIQRTFPNIFYSKTLYNRKKGSTEVFVVKKVQNWTDAHAFIPLVTTCEELEIQEMLNARTSAFAAVEVSNFRLQYIRVVAQVQISKGYNSDGVAQQVNRGINIFLSPWIQNIQEQLTIDQGVSAGQVAAFIKTFDGVETIKSISLQKSIKNKNSGKITYSKSTTDMIPEPSGILLVPSLDNSQIVYI